MGLEQSLQRLLVRPNFYNQCELWRGRKQRKDLLCNVYDGNVWKEFQSFHDSPFLFEEGNLAVMINFDLLEFCMFGHICGIACTQLLLYCKFT